MIRLPRPPAVENKFELEQWFDSLWRYVKPTIQLINDVAAVIGSGSTHVCVIALTAPRILSLPASTHYQDGDELVILDESGAAGTHTITVDCDGTDTIDGAANATISANHGHLRLVKRGAGAFFTI